ncbi:hypothetical protein BDBG_17933, partial [Blastomyces gilchristii SLH14081]
RCNNSPALSSLHNDNDAIHNYHTPGPSNQAQSQRLISWVQSVHNRLDWQRPIVRARRLTRVRCRQGQRLSCSVSYRLSLPAWRRGWKKFQRLFDAFLLLLLLLLLFHSAVP